MRTPAVAETMCHDHKSWCCCSASGVQEHGCRDGTLEDRLLMCTHLLCPRLIADVFPGCPLHGRNSFTYPYRVGNVPLLLPREEGRSASSGKSMGKTDQTWPTSGRRRHVISSWLLFVDAALFGRAHVFSRQMQKNLIYSFFEKKRCRTRAMHRRRMDMR